MHDIVTAISDLCRRYVKWAEEMLFCTEEYRKAKTSSLRNTSTPISKTTVIEKIFLRKILCRKNKKFRSAEIRNHPSYGFFCAQNRTNKKHLQDMIASFLQVFLLYFIEMSIFDCFYWVTIWLVEYFKTNITSKIISVN